MTKVVKLLLSRISADHRGLSMVLSKSYERKLHSIFHYQMIPARENLLFPTFYKSNNLHCQLIDVSVNNANDWKMDDVDIQRHHWKQSPIVFESVDNNANQ